MAFDLNSLEMDSETFLHLKHPVSGEELYSDGKPVGIVLYGPASKEHREVTLQLQNRHLMRQKKGKEQTAEERIEESTRLLVGLSKEAKELLLDGSPITSAAQFRQLYTEGKWAWLKKQVDEVFQDDANFIKGSV